MRTCTYWYRYTCTLHHGPVGTRLLASILGDCNIAVLPVACYPGHNDGSQRVKYQVHRAFGVACYTIQNTIFTNIHVNVAILYNVCRTGMQYYAIAIRNTHVYTGTGIAQ